MSVELRPLGRDAMTVATPIELSGAGLHTGAPASVRISPRDEIGFSFVDGQTATARDVVETRLGSVIDLGDGRTARTVEHLLAGLVLAGVDAAAITLDGPEAPILDGSAAPFAAAAIAAGRRTLAGPATGFAIVDDVQIVEGDRRVAVRPAMGRTVAVKIDFPDAAIGVQSADLDLDSPPDRERFAVARTFCRRSEIDAMQATGLALGGSLDNAIVVDGAEILNADGLRAPNEFAMHKALDLIGDLALLGRPLIGAVEAFKPGHDLNNRLARALLDHAGDV